MKHFGPDLDPLLELESDQATMEVPSPVAGKVTAILIKVGDKVSKGSVILTLEAADAAAAPTKPAAPAASPAKAPAAVALPAAAALPVGSRGDVHGEVVILGAGLGGYTASFRAADLGKQVVLIEKDPTLGGVCLNVGCIPSKALLHADKVITEAEEMSGHGLSFAKLEIDTTKLRGWKASVVKGLTTGLNGLAKGRKVIVLRGTGQFTGPNMIEVDDGEKKTRISFDQCVIAAGSEPVTLPFIPHNVTRVLDSTGALELDGIPTRMLVLGGGIIGLKMACVYDALGSTVTVVELMDQLLTGENMDIVKPLHKRIEARYEKIMLKTKVTKVEAAEAGITVTFEDDAGASSTDTFDKILVAVGRRPNVKRLRAEAAGVTVDDRGFIAVDNQQRTNVAHIFAIGDVVGQPMLAHKAVHEGKVAAEVATGHDRTFDTNIIPSFTYTDPEVAWVGVTETVAKAEGRMIGKGVFPWAASGRSLALGRSEGITKLIFDEADDRVIGAAIVGPNAGDLIAEVALAIEMGADATDIGRTIHPHPTLSETVNFAAEMFEGTITDLVIRPLPGARDRIAARPACLF